MKESFPRDIQYYKFSIYGFLKNLKFFDPFIILFFKEVGLSFFEIGTLFSIREIATNILEIPTGIVADSYGRRISMIFSFVSYIISFIIFYLFTRFLVYAIAMIFFAFGEAFRTGTHKAMILEYLKIKNLTKYRVDYYGHTRGWSQFGSAISSFIAAALVFYSGSYRIIFLASVIPYVFDLFLMISYPKELDGVIAEVRGKNSIASAFEKITNTLKNFVGIFKKGGVVRALLNSSIYDAFFKTVKDYLQPIVKQYALLIPIFLLLEEDRRTSVLIGLVYFLLFILTMFSSRNASKVSKKMKSLNRAINVTYLAGGFLLLAMGILLFKKLYIMSIGLFVLFYMLENLKRPISLGYVSELISSKIMAAGLSSESQLKTIFVAVFSPLMGFLSDKFGIGVGLVMMSIILFAVFPVVAVKNINDREGKC